MNSQELFEYIKSTSIVTAQNVGDKESPKVKIILKSKEEVIVDQEFLNDYSVFLQVEKSKPLYWDVKEKK